MEEIHLFAELEGSAGRRRPPERRALCWGLTLVPVLLLGSLAASAPVVSAAGAPTMAVSLGTNNLTLQGTALEGLSQFDLGPAGMNVQTASATARDPYREVTLAEVPYGAFDADDPAIGPSYPGAAPRARASLEAYRESQQALPLGNLQAALFGAEVTGAANLVDLDVDGPTPTPTAIVEWVTEAQGGLWLIRAAEEVGSPGTQTQAGAVLADLADITVSAGSDLAGAGLPQYVPSTAMENGTVSAASSGGLPPAVSTPSWWSGTCDTNDYSAAAQTLVGVALPAYPLSGGATWDGLSACGPRPEYGEGPDVSVHFPGAQWGVLEWECVELSMRWMYEEWNVNPYPANGSNVVWNYATFQSQYNPHGPALTAVANNGAGPMPVPGDVLSYGAASTAGHTSVVTATSIAANGDGTVTVLEENASATGWDTVSVSDWILGGFDGGVTGWLHNPAIRGPSGGSAALTPAQGRSLALPPAVS
jgi:hypothetical protein